MWPDLHQHRRKTDEGQEREKQERQKVGERREQCGNHDTHDSRKRDDHNCRNERWRRETSNPLWKKKCKTFEQHENSAVLRVSELNFKKLIQAYDDILNRLTILYITINGYSKNKSLFSFKYKKYFKGRLTANF